MRSDIVPRAVFPEYELPDHTTKRRKLSELQGHNPMVLVLSRGGFCPKERRQAEGLVALHREIEVGYCRLVTISTDNIAETNEYRSGVGAHWPFRPNASVKRFAVTRMNSPALNWPWAFLTSATGAAGNFRCRESLSCG